MNQQTTDASAIFAPLWKHRWLILIVGVLVGGLSYLYYRHEARTFSSSTQVYLGSGSEEQGLFSNNQAKSTLGDRTVTDQVSLINSAAIGQLVHNKLRAEHDHAALLGTAHAKATSGSDFISITAEAHSAKGAETLASTYAQVYIKRQREDYQHNIKTGLSVARKQLRRIEAAQAASAAQAAKTTAAKAKGKGTVTGKSSAGSSGALQESNIASRINQLESDLGVAGVEQISPTKAKATLTSSSPKRNAIFGFVLGIVLACVAAFTLSRLDRRLQSIAAIESIFHTQVLAALPHVRQPVVRADGLSRPAKPLLEPLRRLHTTLQLSSMLDHDASPRLILFLSADAGDGKSTVAADLALVQADAGERVAVVEADFRRPVLGKLLNVDGADGLAEVLAGKRSVGEALQIARSASSLAGSDHDATGGGVGTLVESPSIGSLAVLVGSTTVANPPALLARETTAELLRGLAEDHDRVLIDAPGLLEVSDAMPLLGFVDGIVIVARLGHTRELSAQRLVELLTRNSSASVLGVVVNDTPRSALASYGFAAEPGGRRLLPGILRR
jgi:Mrp family chromosome partitioning ATPase/capsular polysaccharide biosynthesis protein